LIPSLFNYLFLNVKTYVNDKFTLNIVRTPFSRNKKNVETN